MEEQLYRIVSQGEGVFKDRGSRFLGFAFPVRDIGQVEQAIQSIKKTYHDARHHCTAYRLGDRTQTSYANDDGEPSHSAGTPILGAIRSLQLTDTLVVVVRYFGGTKLGVRGLIEAYRTAAELALEEAQKQEIVHRVHFSLRFGYERTSALNRIMHPFEFDLVSADYTDICEQHFAVKEEIFPQVQASLQREQFVPKILEVNE
ncbi:MAG: YigZ family protein [Bacteroidota bacterium]